MVGLKFKNQSEILLTVAKASLLNGYTTRLLQTFNKTRKVVGSAFTRFGMTSQSTCTFLASLTSVRFL